MATGQYIGVNGVARKVTAPYVGVNGVARRVTSGYVGVNGVARLFFAPDNGIPVILEVEKVTSDTYANETTYTAEEFILLDIYPKTGGTVNVTYGGLTKTITDTSGSEEPNAQQVFFGTFNGVTDNVATPSSGELTIEGDCYAFGCGVYSQSSKATVEFCGCITSIGSFGKTTMLPADAFGGFTTKMVMTTIEIPDTILRIGDRAFYGHKLLQSVTIGKGVLSIGVAAFASNTDNVLTTVKILATTPPKLVVAENSNNANFGTIGDSKFKVEKIIVPKGCGASYKAATGWSTYADYIAEET